MEFALHRVVYLNSVPCIIFLIVLVVLSEHIILLHLVHMLVQK